MPRLGRHALRIVALFAVCLVALQLGFVARIAAMAWFDPTSTTFQRSEMWRLAKQRGRLAAWAHHWVGLDRISPNLARAVLAAEDSSFTEHRGVEWDAIERAWERNQRGDAAVPTPRSRSRASQVRLSDGATGRRLHGGSTITQQLAKNLLLSSEQTVLRKSQEFVLTLALEGMLDKRRILEIYLNHVEWGEGLFGAQVAARHYHRVDAAALTRMQAAKLAVMLPAPKRFERQPDSPYLQARAAKVAAGMTAVEAP